MSRRKAGQTSLFILAFDDCLHFDGQPVKIDKALRVFLVVIAFAERSDFFAVKRMTAPRSRVYDIALIEFKPYLTRNGFLRFIDERAQRLAEWL